MLNMSISKGQQNDLNKIIFTKRQINHGDACAWGSVVSNSISENPVAWSTWLNAIIVLSLQQL